MTHISTGPMTRHSSHPTEPIAGLYNNQNVYVHRLHNSLIPLLKGENTATGQLGNKTQLRTRPRVPRAHQILTCLGGQIGTGGTAVTSSAYAQHHDPG